VAGKWKKPPAALVEAFERAFLDFPDAERRQMFGCPCVFLNGNMVSGLHEESWISPKPPCSHSIARRRRQ
jgi:hypothetical protein